MELPGAVLVIATGPAAALAPNITARLEPTVTVPAKRLPAHPAAGSPMRTGTVAFVNDRAWVDEGAPAMSPPHRLKKMGALATMPPLTLALISVKAPPAFTVTGP